MSESINDRIRKYRNLRKLTQVEVAESLGMKSSTYSQMERGGSITTDRLIKIAHLLTVDVRELLFGNFYNFTVPKPEITPKLQEFNIDLTLKEINYIKILRFLEKSDRRDVIEYMEQKYHNALHKKPQKKD